MLEDDAAGRRAHGPRCHDKVSLLKGEHLPAHQPGDDHPVDEGDGDDHLQHRVAQDGPIATGEDCPQEDDEQQVGEREGQVGEPHHQVVEESAAKGRNPSHQQADGQDDDLNAQPNLEGDPGALQHP